VIRTAVSGACGRMGRLIIENILGSKDMELVAPIDITNIGKDLGEVIGARSLGVQIIDAKNIDAALKRTRPDLLIDFTIAHAAVENVRAAAQNKVNLVVGTTGFTPEQRAEMEKVIKENKVAAVISPNFSLGINVFWELLEKAAFLLKEYDIEIVEAHHNQKKDAPSGTAVKAAEIISTALGGKEIVYGRKGISPRGKEIGMHSIRGGDIIGDHLVLFAGEGERIEIKHQAHSRQAFAAGAIKAARWIVGAKPGIYGMGDVMGISFR